MRRAVSMNTFAGRLRKVRHWRNLSQAELAARVGVPASSISHFEIGSRKPSFDTLAKLADALNVSADYLLGRVNMPSQVVDSVIAQYVEPLTAENRELAIAFLTMLAKRERKMSVSQLVR